MNSRPKTTRLASLLLALPCALMLCLPHAIAQAVKPADPMPPPRTQTPVPTTADIQRTPPAMAADDDEDVIKLGVFEVNAKARGFYADTTMAGTRIASSIEDLGASITVITTEMMDDFGMTDINDIFNFEVSTEGMATFTDVEVDSNGNASDGNMDNPGSANRVRGLRSPNRTYGNFETTRMPFDRLIIGGTELVRGPSSIIAGLGNPAGTINAIPISPNLNKNTSELRLRTDSNNGFRQTLDFNRVLIRNRLAFAAQQLFQHTGYQRKPSGANMEIYNFAVKYQPFKKTTFNVNYTRYRESGNRANSLTPGDGITPWRQRGEYTWDPTQQNTGSYYSDTAINPATDKPYPPFTINPTAAQGSAYDRNGNMIVGTANTAYMTNAGLQSLWQSSGRGTSLIFVDRDGSTVWMAPRPSDGDNAFANDQTGYKFAIARQAPVLDPGLPTPMNSGAVRGVSDREIYDWTRINIAATDRFYKDNNALLVRMTQEFINTQKHYLAVELGWLREDSNEYSKALMGKSKKNQTSSYLAIDVNRKLFDGSDNPNYLRPYLAVNQDLVAEEPVLNDSYRAQMAYKLDFRQDTGWTKWLGQHTLTAYAEYKQFESRRYNYRHAMVSDHPAWRSPANNHIYQQGARPGDPRGNSSVTGAANTGFVQDQLSAFETRNYAFYYIGDAIGQNIDYSPGTLTTGRYNYYWGNAVTGLFHRTPAELGLAADLGGSGGANSNLKVTKGMGAVLQSHLINNGIVVTVGQRHDTVYQKEGVPPRLMPDGITFDYAYNNRWVDNWRINSGNTTAEGIVVKPSAWIKADAPLWLRPLRRFSFFYNQSGSLDLNVPVRYSLKGEVLPNPTGTGKDYGFTVRMFNDRLIARFNRYENYTVNQRGTPAPVGRVIHLDIYEANYDGGEDDESWEDQAATRAFGLNRVATIWMRHLAQINGEILTDDELFRRVANFMGMTPERLHTMQFRRDQITETDEGLAKGIEISLYYSPTDYLDFRFGFSQAEARNMNVAPGFAEYLEERLEFWKNVIDPTTGARWWTSAPPDTDRTQTAEAWFNSSVLPDWELAKAQEGMPQPTISKYTFVMQTSLRLSGITNHRILRGAGISAGVRYQSPVSIGNYGIDANNPDNPVTHTTRDPNRVVWDKNVLYVSMGISYKTKIFNGKVGAEFRLGVENLLEDGRLRAVRADTNGTPTVFRIVDPRSITFDARFKF